MSDSQSPCATPSNSSPLPSYSLRTGSRNACATNTSQTNSSLHPETSYMMGIGRGGCCRRCGNCTEQGRTPCNRRKGPMSYRSVGPASAIRRQPTIDATALAQGILIV
eukprot:9491607-Pyramimonas_sp.AAC.1